MSDKTIKYLLQCEGLLERISRREEVGSGSRRFWRCHRTLADEAGHLVDLFPSFKEYPKTEVWCLIPEFGSSSWSSFPSSWQTPKRKEDLQVRIDGSWCREQIQGHWTIVFVRAFQRIYKGPLKWPDVLQVAPGREFMGDVKKEMSKHDIRIRMGIVDIHHDQGIVEHFNRTLSECLQLSIQ